ncbi:preprotein translocase subunit SecE [Candidatus Saccharibacteria bacterium]|nr:preprotein translocase subunit SecE [Candidatus Saccharibacteria bacterium]
MAKSAKGKSKQKSQNRITRITAGDKAAKPKKPNILATAKELAGRAQTEKSSTKTAKTSVKTKTAASKPKNSKSRRNPLSAITGYFRGAWQEIKQVRWPARRSTWGMVGALIVFTAALFLVIILLDYGFAWLFKLIMGTK